MKEFQASQRFAAWAVHVFTSTGIVSGFMAILAIERGAWQEAMLWMVACQLIDGIDGTLARYFRVKEVLPFMDGTTIDQVIDFATYALIPAFFLYHASLVPDSLRLACAAVMLLAAALYYGKDGMISADFHFVGFPVMWNVVVFFLFFVVHLAPEWNAALIFFFAVLHFVPLRYPYPSRMTSHQAPTLVLTTVAILASVYLVWIYPAWNAKVAALPVAGLGWYAYLTLRSSFPKR